MGPQLQANSQLYTLSDLEVLEQEKNTQEFLNHALDVKPQLRDKHYKEMVEHMAILHLKNLIKKQAYDQKNYRFVQEISEWPLLQSDPFFQSKKNDYAQRYFEKCFQKNFQTNHLKCEGELLKYWHNSNFDPDLGIHFLGLVTKEKGHQLQQWDFIKRALISPQSEYFCKRDEVSHYISFILQHHSEKTDSDQELLKKLRPKFNQDCLKQLFPVFKAKFSKSDLREKRHLFRFLSLYNQVDHGQKKAYLTEVFLSRPYPSKEFNMAWNSIKELGQNHELRLKVIAELGQKDLLPGNVFNLKSKMRGQTLVKFLYHNFPEYIDLYSKTCIKYMKGKGSFPYGNPTPNCKKLFSSYTQYLDSGLINSYKEIKKASFSRGL